MKQQLQAGINALDLVISEQQMEQLIAFAQLLQKWNKVYNLTAIADLQDIVNKHFLDSLAVVPHLHDASTILDVGTGGGFPGIPLAIVHRDKSFVLLDSNSKKTRFLKQVVASLALTNVTVEHVRIEEYQPKHGFDIIISRAFSALNDMIALTERLLSGCGKILAMKGEVLNQDLPPGFVAQTIALTVPNTKSRHLVIVERG